MEANKRDRLEQERNTNHLVRAILLESGVMYDGTQLVDGKFVPDTPSAMALRLVESGVRKEEFIVQLREAGLEV